MLGGSAKAARAPSRRQGNQGNEYTMEFYYAYRPLAGLQVRPNIQYVIDPAAPARIQTHWCSG